MVPTAVAAGPQMSHLHFFPWPPPNLRELVLDHDIVLVAGGNTANAIAVWRAHGFDTILREAWERGVLLAGWSAGMICWFEHGVTDSFGPELAAMECLGFLPGSACPHYDGEERRRPVFTQLVADGLPAGIAADDDVGLVYAGTELQEIVTSQAGATAYRVEPDGERALEARAAALAAETRAAPCGAAHRASGRDPTGRQIAGRTNSTAAILWPRLSIALAM